MPTSSAAMLGLNIHEVNVVVLNCWVDRPSEVVMRNHENPLLGFGWALTNTENLRLSY